jgi:hypothetical protein
MDNKFFRSKILDISNDEALLDFCRKYILHGTPTIFNGDDEKYYEFRKRISNFLNVSFNDIYISGSAKLGFSPYKQTIFSYESDIDVSIISKEKFEFYMEHVKNFQMELRANRRTVTEKELKMYHQFLEYTAIGWFRPDKLPHSFGLNILKTDWFDFFKSISYGKSEVGNYKVSAAIFKSYTHYENYSFSGLQQIKQKVNNIGALHG